MLQDFALCLAGVGSALKVDVSLFMAATHGDCEEAHEAVLVSGWR